MAEGKAGSMWSTLAVLIVGTFITILNSSLINIALPKMMAVFGVSLDDIQWVVTAYTIALGAVIPISGYLANLFGSKRTYIGALAMFTLGSVLCGFAWNNASMIAFRIIQGIGGGIIGPVGNAIIFRTIPPEQRGVAMGLYGVAAMAAPAIGPTTGGYIIAHLSWRMLFFISVPFGIIGVLMGIIMMAELPKQAPGAFDTVGFITSTVGLVCLFYVMGKWNSIDWGDMTYPLLLILGIFSLAMFVINELMHPAPLLDLRVLKNFEFTAWNVIMCVLTMSMMGTTFIVPIFLQNLLGYTAMQTGMLLFPSAIATALAMPFSGKLFDRYGHRFLMTAGLGILIVSNYLFVSLNTDTAAGTINLLLILRGIALGMAMMPPMTLAMAQIPPAMINQASSLSNIIRQVSSAVSIALITTLFQRGITLGSADIGSRISATDPMITDAVRGLQGLYYQGGLGPQEAASSAVSVIAGLVQRQAYVNSMDFILWLMTLLAGMALAFYLLVDIYRARVSVKKSPALSEEGAK